MDCRAKGMLAHRHRGTQVCDIDTSDIIHLWKVGETRKSWKKQARRKRSPMFWQMHWNLFLHSQVCTCLIFFPVIFQSGLERKGHVSSFSSACQNSTSDYTCCHIVISSFYNASTFMPITTQETSSLETDLHSLSQVVALKYLAILYIKKKFSAFQVLVVQDKCKSVTNTSWDMESPQNPLRPLNYRGT